MVLIRLSANYLKIKVIVPLFATTILALILTCSYTWAGASSREEGNIENGKKTYKRYCSACHGRKGKGDGQGAIISGIPPRDLTNKAYMAFFTDKGLFKRIKEGEKKFPYLQMSGIGHKASKSTIWDIIAYIHTLAVNKGAYKGLTPREQEKRFKDPLVRGRIYYLRYCSPCHGKTGDGKGWAARTLEGTPIAHNDPIVMSEFTRQQIYKHVRGIKVKKDRSMPVFMKAFTANTVKRIAAYTKTLSKNADK